MAFKKKQAFILVPTFEKNKYHWPNLIIKKSPLHGLGVFTTDVVEAGLLLPILGFPLSKTDVNNIMKKKGNGLSHVWIYQSNAYPFYAVDGHPKYNQNNLHIAMMINEDPKHKPNCFFKMDFVVITKKLPPNTELTIDYGPHYNREEYEQTQSKRKEYIYPRFSYPSVQERVRFFREYQTKKKLEEKKIS